MPGNDEGGRRNEMFQMKLMWSQVLMQVIEEKGWKRCLDNVEGVFLNKKILNKNV